MDKPTQHFKIGDEVIHLGTDIGTRQGEEFTILSNLQKAILDRPDGTFEICYCYKLDSNGIVGGKNVGAKQEWLKLKHTPSNLTFKELVSHFKREGLIGRC